MELQWKSTPCTYLHSSVRQIQNQEQTLELRLTEGLPDIGRVLCVWGQTQLRGKEWRADAISAHGGVNAWVLYVPEDGSEPRCAEGWIPFQAKWPLPDNTREGMICAQVVLRSLDARTLSPRKILLRASLGLLGEALEPREAAVYTPDELPEDICLLHRTYPMQLLREVGEKLFSLDETLSMPTPMPRKLLSCRLVPMVTEQAVTGNRLVLRGHVGAQYVAIGEDGRLHSGMVEVPFAQFADLGRSYDKEAMATLTMALTDAECNLEENGLQVRCSLVAQYGVHGQYLLELTEDAYSPSRPVTPTMEQLQLPVLLDRFSHTMEMEADVQADVQQLVDVTFLPDLPAQYREEGSLVVEMPGTLQILYYDPDDQLQAATRNWAGRWEVAADTRCTLHLQLTGVKQKNALTMGEQLHLSGALGLDVQTVAMQQTPMVTALQVGEQRTVDPRRPSVILRRCGDDNLWQIAKACGSTVEAIEKANQLLAEPQPNQMLLIPVL